jgi:hypothetical protein
MNECCPSGGSTKNQPRLDLHAVYPQESWRETGDAVFVSSYVDQNGCPFKTYKVQKTAYRAKNAGVFDKNGDEPQYPLTVVLKCCDTQEGDGWGRSELDKHGVIHDAYLCGIGRDECYYAVLVTFNTKEALLEAFVSCGPELVDYIPEPE